MRHEQEFAAVARRGGSEGSLHLWINPQQQQDSIEAQGGDREGASAPTGKEESHLFGGGFHFEWERKGIWS